MAKNNKLIISVALIAIIAIALVSVGLFLQNQNNNNEPSPSVSPTSTNTATPSDIFPLILTDNEGNTITLNKYPEKIVSLAPAVTEILFAVGAGDNVIGITDYCDYPYNFTAWVESGNITSIGSYYKPAIEPIVALNPDLVVAARGSSDAANQLRDLGYTVLTLDPSEISHTLENIHLVGQATGNEQQATNLISSLQTRIDAVVNGVVGITSKPTVYVELYSDPYTSVGKGTFINSLIQMVGGQNIYENETNAYPDVSVEFVIAQNPDIIIFPDSMGLDLLESFAGIKDRDGWATINAIQTDSLYIVDADALNRPAPRQVDALEALAKILHPEIFGEYTYQP